MISTALLLFIIQVFFYCVVTINYRACAQGKMKLMIVTDGLIASFSFFVIKHISEIGGTALIPWIGYALGGMVGSALGLYISKKMHKEKE